MTKNRYSVILGNLGNTCDRFLPTGYKAQPDKFVMIQQAASIPGLEGLELVGGWDVTTENAGQIHASIREHKLECVSIIPDLFSQSRWGAGSFCSRDERVRRQAVEETHSAAQIATQMGCPLINLWLGQDGYDYPLQSDFGRERMWMVEGIRAVAETWPQLRFALEYKPKEPRTHSFHARAADTLLMAQEIGLDNVGVCIDVGHAMVAQENVAESAWLLSHYGQKLFHMHYNDNYGCWDDDMIVGSIHFTQYVELCYWLKKIGYDGWHSMDQYPYREDAVRAISESIAMLRAIEDALTPSRLTKIDELLQTGDATRSARWVREFIFGRSCASK